MGEGGFGDEECPGDFGGGESGDGAEGEGELGAGGQRRVAAEEDHFEGVVAEGGLMSGRSGGFVRGGWDVAAELIESAAFGDEGEPGGGVRRDAVEGPGLEGAEKGVLQALFGEGDVSGAEHAHERAEDGGVLAAKEVFGQGAGVFGGLVRVGLHYMVGSTSRTSIVPNSR